MITFSINMNHPLIIYGLAVALAIIFGFFCFKLFQFKRYVVATISGIISLFLSYAIFTSRNIEYSNLDNSGNSVYTNEETSGNSEQYISNENQMKNNEISIDEYIIQNNFTINGGGSVSFTAHSSTNGTVTIQGGRALLEGLYKIEGNRIFISELRAIDGYFDASNNNGSYGTISMSNNGDLSGYLQSGQDYTKIILKPIN